MPNGPRLPLQVHALIERERSAIFGTAETKYNLLFGGILIDLPDFSLITTLKHSPPVSRQADNLILQLQGYALELFDVTAKQLVKHASDGTELTAWLTDLGATTEAEVKAHCTDNSRYDFHCSPSARTEALREALKVRVRYWLKKSETDFDAILRRSQTAMDALSQIMTGFPDPPQLAPASASTPTKAAVIREKSLGELLDEIVLEGTVSHEQLAENIGISRSAYFEVKAGRGGKKVKSKTRLYLSKRSVRNLD